MKIENNVMLAKSAVVWRSGPHLATELFCIRPGIKMQHIKAALVRYPRLTKNANIRLE